MRKLITYTLLALIGFNCQSCSGKSKKNKDMMTKFSWSPSVSMPNNYPVELLRCNVGFGDNGQSIPIMGHFAQGGIGVSGAGGVDLNAFDIERGLPVPNSIDILWVSYLEQKYYQANIKFSEELQNRMLELFNEGYYRPDENQRFRYNNLVITLLPEGKIWLYLDGPHRYVRLDYTLQAEEVTVNFKDFVETRHNTLEEFCTGRLTDHPEAVENFAKNGIPKGLWDVYAERFPYDIKIDFENEQTVINPDYGYICSNGEMFGNLDSVKSYPMARLNRLIMVWNVADTTYSGYFYFNEDDVIKNFREAFGNNPNPNIRGEFSIKVSKYNNWFDIFLRVGEKEVQFDNVQRTQIHVFKKWPGRTDKDDPVFYDNYRGEDPIKYIGE